MSDGSVFHVQSKSTERRAFYRMASLYAVLKRYQPPSVRSRYSKETIRPEGGSPVLQRAGNMLMDLMQQDTLYVGGHGAFGAHPSLADIETSSYRSADQRRWHV